MQPVRIIKVTTGKTAAYDLAASLRDRGAMVTTTNLHGRTYYVRVYREPTTKRARNWPGPGGQEFDTAQ